MVGLEEIREELKRNMDEGYRRFSVKTNPGAVDLLGVRVPVLRRLAKDVGRGDFREVLASDLGVNFEENLLRGMVIASAKMTTTERLGYVREFVLRIKDWATCDMVAASFRLKEEDLATYWEFLRRYENAKEEFEVRFMLVMMLDYFLVPEYQADVLDVVNENKNGRYYVEMAAAWLVAESLIKNYELTMAFMNSPKNKLTKWVYNKALQKACESRRVTDEQKAELRVMKR